MINNKAAMFGLDARIALAIFGALSVISGAALYSAIQNAQAEAWRQYFNEIIKSTEQYYLDNGKQLSGINTGMDNLYAGDLVTNRESLSTWNGPYVSNTTSSLGQTFKDNMTAKIHSDSAIWIHLRKTTTWAEMNDIMSDEKCTSGDSNCAEWITLKADDPAGTSTLQSIFNNLDRLVDNSDGSLNGTVRYNTANDGYIMYQGIPHKK